MPHLSTDSATVNYHNHIQYTNKYRNNNSNEINYYHKTSEIDFIQQFINNIFKFLTFQDKLSVNPTYLILMGCIIIVFSVLYFIVTHKI